MMQPVGVAAASGSSGSAADHAFQTISRIARAEAGLVLPPDKAPMVMARISKRMRKIGVSSLTDYCALLATDDALSERREMVYALTTNVTSFLREAHHFEQLRERLLPDLVARARAGGRVRLWSAGCSSGQEPYSLAMTILDAFPEAARHDLRVLATDIDPHVLGEARRGSYPAALLEPLPAPWRTRFFEAQAGGEDMCRVTDQVREIIAFRELNLLGPWPMKGRFDAIFCRNVVIYFDRETQAELWTRFHGALADGGHLFLGHSERIDPAGAPFRPVGTTIYQRVDHPAIAHTGT